jgi:8-oxo-dGTP pyrophosphatase MutT (NUDIX family)
MKPAAAETPVARQIAALPIRWDKEGRLCVLMVTSRGTGRWVMPKGWLMDGKKPWRAAKIEALEEAGAVGFISDKPLGEYGYLKELDDGTAIPVRVCLYPMIVDKLKKHWKERSDRTRKWFSAKGAAKRVDEPELQALLLALADTPRKKSTIRQLVGKMP